MNQLVPTGLSLSPGRLGRLAPLAWAFGCALTLLACAQPASQKCTTGIYCPEGTECAAVQKVCIINSCGNGRLDVGEKCDDGNIQDGDGCSANCLSQEKCGNAILDPGEVCDDGNNVSGDGCSLDCKSIEICGNGIVDTAAGEVCDDGNTVSGDSCSANCKSNETCGNGIVDTAVGEICDDGNTVSGDGCNADCRSGEGCGNGVVDKATGEICDDGNLSDNDDCRNDCRPNLCGDGFLNSGGSHPEQCDAAPKVPKDSNAAKPVETAGCNLDCTIASCGDAKVNVTAGEQCDTGTDNGDTKNCTATCQVNVCGDAKVDMEVPRIEACDDGNTNNLDACSNNCTIATCGDGVLQAGNGEQCDDGNTVLTDACQNCKVAKCGDGIVYMGVEACDDGNNVSGDGCSASCTNESCGNGVIDPGEQCDDANTISSDACINCQNALCGDGYVEVGVEKCDPKTTPTNNGAGCSATCQLQSCGNGTVDPGEQCDDGNAVNTDACVNCKNAVCGDTFVYAGHEACDSTPGCSATCMLQSCGNGSLDPGEACDDHNNVAGDGCSPVCTFEYCGDGVLTKVAPFNEVCDPGALGETSLCNRDCTAATCGDGKVNAAHGEQCDDGNTVATDACPTGPAATTHACLVAICGDGIVGPGEGCDDGNRVDNDACSNGCKAATCGDGIVNGTDECDDGNTVNTDGCLNTCVYAKCGDLVIQATPLVGTPAVAPEACDDGNTINNDGCNNVCGKPKCGNFIVDQGEQCDDGNTVSGDGCNATCQFEKCGDGIVGPGEACDWAKAGSAATCNLDCTLSSCGDGKLNTTTPSPAEQCDDGNNVAGDGCSPTCKIERCGNGVVDSGEQCDPGSIGTFTATCNNDCTMNKCGDGKLNPNAIPAEQCDDKNLVSGDGCSSTCQSERCGNGVVDSGEACDPGTPGAFTASCNNDCTANACGDGKLNPKAVPAETCDDKNLVNGDGCSSTCQLEHCGNGVVDSGETCDNGASNGDTKPCTSACQKASCGDGKVDSVGGLAGGSTLPVETCDDGNAVTEACPYGAKSCTVCGAACTMVAGAATFCGDGTVNNGEACDPGAAGETATCNRDCTVRSCGDSKVNATAGEQCDLGTGVNSNTGACTLACKLPNCGDGFIQTGETCDDGVNQGAPCAYGVGTTCSRCNPTCTGLITETVPRCGDSVISTNASNVLEACDDGNAVTETACPYGMATCGTLCNATCTATIPGLKGNVCGDGNKDATNETCDNGNALGCGLCSADCQTVIVAAAATGTIIAASPADIADGKTFTLSDGLHVVVFEFDKNATFTSATNIKVDINAAVTNLDVATAIAAAINGVPAASFTINAGTVAGVVIPLTNTLMSAAGNVTASTTVASPNFVIFGMSGGAGGDCGPGIGCSVNTDCLSGTCLGTKKCQ